MEKVLAVSQGTVGAWPEFAVVAAGGNEASLGGNYRRLVVKAMDCSVPRCSRCVLGLGVAQCCTSHKLSNIRVCSAAAIGRWLERASVKRHISMMLHGNRNFCALSPPLLWCNFYAQVFASTPARAAAGQL